jgi:hypothetical protein
MKDDAGDGAVLLLTHGHWEASQSLNGMGGNEDLDLLRHTEEVKFNICS